MMRRKGTKPVLLGDEGLVALAYLGAQWAKTMDKRAIAMTGSTQSQR